MDNYSEDQIIEKAREILAARMINSEPLASPQQSADFLIMHLAEKEAESFCVIYLDSRHRVISFEEAFRGTIDGAAVYPREIVKAALLNNAAALIFAHNHPSGVAEPSAADRQITERLVNALALVEVRVLDHIIVGGTSTYSFAEHGLF